MKHCMQETERKRDRVYREKEKCRKCFNGKEGIGEWQSINKSLGSHLSDEKANSKPLTLGHIAKLSHSRRQKDLCLASIAQTLIEQR